jgi:hypothetical protein
MNILINGYFKVTTNKDSKQPLHVVCKGANHEPLSSSENLPNWEAVKTNILAQIRASNGKNALVVDATKQNLEKKNLYYKIQENGKLKAAVVADETDEEIEKAAEEAALAGMDGPGLGTGDIQTEKL